jgi:hypothetical protein
MWVRLKIIIVSLFIVLINSRGFSQSAQKSAFYDLIFFPQGYMLPDLSGYGYSNTMSDISNIGNMNPASLSSFNSIAGGISYQFDSKIHEAWTNYIGYYKNKDGMPQSAGFVCPYNDFRFGIGFKQKFNGSLDFGKIPVTTIDNPDGTDEYYSPTYDYNLISYSLSASWSAYNTIVKEDKLSFGIRIDLDRLSAFQKIGDVEAYGQINNTSYAMGLTYEVRIENKYNYQLSFYFEKGVDFTGVMTFNEPTFTTVYTSDSSHAYTTDNSPITAIGKTPDRINAGVDFNVSVPLSISADFTYVLWHNISPADNEPEVSVSASYNVSDLVSFSLGTYFIRYNSSFMNEWTFSNNQLNAVYLTAGTVIHYGMLDFNVGLADSHLMSGNWRKQTVGMVSMSVHM